MAYKTHEAALEHQRQYYLLHHDERLAYQKKRDAGRREENVIYQKQYRLDHPDEISAKKKVYTAANRDKKKVYDHTHLEYGRNYAAANADKRHAYMQIYWKTVVGKEVRHRANQARRCGGRINRELFLAKCDMMDWKCQLCGETLTRETVTVDHIIPVSKGGHSEIENLQPLCFLCNSRKNARSMEDMLSSGTQTEAVRRSNQYDRRPSRDAGLDKNNLTYIL